MSVFVTGDIHGDDIEFLCRLDAYERDNLCKFDSDDLIICLGDVGIKYGQIQNSKLIYAMNYFYHGAKFLVIRGNHDCRYWAEAMFSKHKERFKVLEKFENEVLIHTKYPNVYFAKDSGGVYEIKGMPFLAIPGAYSIDKEFRLKSNYPYEPNEQLTKDEMVDLLIDASKLDGNDRKFYVVSHTCPNSWSSKFSDLFFDGVDQSKVDKTMEIWMDALYGMTKTNCLGWYFGHYHDNRDIDGTCGHMIFRQVVKLF